MEILRKALRIGDNLLYILAHKTTTELDPLFQPLALMFTSGSTNLAYLPTSISSFQFFVNSMVESLKHS